MTGNEAPVTTYEKGTTSSSASALAPDGGAARRDDERNGGGQASHSGDLVLKSSDPAGQAVEGPRG